MEFLQTEAREWLEAVLEEKLDPHTSLQDLLADGTILYRISLIVKENLGKLKGNAANRPAAAVPSPDVNRTRTSLKYQPYSYVEAFLKVCKDVGLLDLDLFNPSDAVDKKDIRHVCVCLLRLSKKARTLNIHLPDFDNPKHTLLSPPPKHLMPSDVVHNLRDSLQQPSNGPASAKSNIILDLDKEISSSAADLSMGDSESNSVSPEVDSRGLQQPRNALQDPENVGDFSGDLSAMEPKDLDEYVRPVNHNGLSEKPQPVVELGIGTLKASQSPRKSPDALEQYGAKEKGMSRNPKGRYSWFPYAAGVVFVGVLVVMVVARERRRPSLGVYEVQPTDSLAEISRRTGNATWQEL